MTALLKKDNLTANFLGGVQILLHGRAVTNFATKKILALLCILLDNPQTVFSRDKLMSLFWG
ncbi:MAG: hypothetical protein V2A61_03145, partial [Calditrichota bacterium]